MRRLRIVDADGSSSELAEVELLASDRLLESGGQVYACSDGENVEPLRVARSGKTAWIWHRGRTFEFRLGEPARHRRPGTADESEFRAPMPGKLARVCIPENQAVTRGTTLLILEAMKMEHEIKAPRNGRVARFRHPAGTQVDAGSVLLDFEFEEGDV